MASSGLLLLLMSSFLICSLSVPQPSDLQKTRSLQKRGNTKKNIKDTGTLILEILNAAKPFIGLINGTEGLLAILDFVNVITGKSPNKEVLNFLKKEFDKLNFKLDKNQKKQKWEIWTSSQFGDLEKKINSRWDKIEELKASCSKSKIESLKKEKKDVEIKSFFAKAEIYLNELHNLIVGSGQYKPTYENLLTDQVRCHQKSLNIFSAVNAGLVNKVIFMTHFYKCFKGVPTNQDTLAKKARDISVAMLKIQKKCLSHPDEFVMLDVKDRIDESKKRKVLAQEIRKYLDETYDKYDWMVVAFKTDRSNYDKFYSKSFNRHFVTTFNATQMGKITVAVAKQARGNHKKTAQVIKALKACYPAPVKCDKVENTFKTCKEMVDGVKVQDMYSAIHVYIHKKHDSAKAVAADEAPYEDSLAPDVEQKVPYVFTDRCGFLIKGIDFGHFRILIRSDEEWMKEDPCKGVDCGGKERGKCVPVENARIGVCECTEKYYGEKCEQSMEDYKKTIFKET